MCIYIFYEIHNQLTDIDDFVIAELWQKQNHSQRKRAYPLKAKEGDTIYGMRVQWLLQLRLYGSKACLSGRLVKPLISQGARFRHDSLINRNKTRIKAKTFFLLTSKEAQNAKIKEDLQAAKKARQEARAKRAEENMKQKNEWASKKRHRKKIRNRKSKPKKAQPSGGKSTERKSKRTEKQSWKQNRHLRNGAQVDRTPCATCSNRYCDHVTVQPWIQC